MFPNILNLNFKKLAIADDEIRKLKCGLMDCYSDGMESSDIIAERINRNYYISFIRGGMHQPHAGIDLIEPAVYMCSRCGQEAPKKCSKCLSTYYCSRECQLIFQFYEI